MDNEMIILDTKYIYIDIIIYMDISRYFYTIISHNDQIQGSPNRDNKISNQDDMMNYNMIYYISYGDLSYIIRDDGVYPILYYYIKEQIEEMDERLEE